MYIATLAQSTQLSLNLSISGVLAIIAGVLILIFPRTLNYIVAAYLIIVGVIQVFNLGG